MCFFLIRFLFLKLCFRNLEITVHCDGLLRMKWAIGHRGQFKFSKGKLQFIGNRRFPSVLRKALLFWHIGVCKANSNISGEALRIETIRKPNTFVFCLKHTQKTKALYNEKQSIRKPNIFSFAKYFSSIKLSKIESFIYY